MSLSHDWNISVSEAKSIQTRLSREIRIRDEFGDVRHVAGADVSLDLKRRTACGAAVVLKFPELVIVQRASAYRDIEFPYVPGLLSFREAPVLLDALRKLTVKPDLIICDGQGIAHPRRLGLACHLGLLADVPAIGVAKSRLLGTHAEPGQAKGASAILYHDGEPVGAVLRTRDSTKPVFVSPGHRVSIESAARFALECCGRYRLPETTRAAHDYANELKSRLSGPCAE